MKSKQFEYISQTICLERKNLLQDKFFISIKLLSIFYVCFKKNTNLFGGFFKLSLSEIVLAFQAKLGSAQSCNFLLAFQPHCLPVAANQRQGFCKAAYPVLESFRARVSSTTNLWLKRQMVNLFFYRSIGSLKC